MHNTEDNQSSKTIRHPSKLKLIINADDFGYCQERSRGIMQLIRNKAISSTTIMVNSQHIQQHLSQLRTYSHMSIGLHLNITQFKSIHLLSNQMNAQCQQLQYMVDRDTKVWKGKDTLYHNLHHIVKSQQCMKAIQQQIHMQIQTFIRVLRRRPSHIDSHNHIHIIPQFARIITRVSQMYGIYRVRMPISPLKGTNNQKLDKYNRLFSKYAQQCRQIYSKHISTQYFIGYETMGRLLTPQTIKQELIDRQNAGNGYVQIMVHPGYRQVDGYCQFSMSKQREHQMNVLTNHMPSVVGQYSQQGRLWNYSQVQHPHTHNHNGKSILIYSKMIRGSGNLTTSLRLKRIYQQLGYSVYLMSEQTQIPQPCTIQYMHSTIVDLRINLVIGINLTKTASTIYKVLHEYGCRIQYRIPYMLIIAGTDANVLVSDENTLNNINKAISKSMVLISLTQEMKTKIQCIYPSSKSKIQVIKQSTADHCYQYTNILQTNINTNTSMKKMGIVFPTSFRKVKAVDHMLQELNTIIQQYNVCAYIFGPVLDQTYYEEVVDKLGKVQYMGSLVRQQYLQYLTTNTILINTSQNQGMSCSILQAFEHKVPVIARNNEGNSSVITHKVNGLLYEDGQSFMQCFRYIYDNHNETQLITNNAYNDYLQKYSLKREEQQYRQVLNTYFLKQTPYIQDSVWLYSLPGVHSVQPINLSIFSHLKQWNNLQYSQLSKGILDMGCGNGVFSIYFCLFCLKHNHKHTHTHTHICETITFSDVCTDALSNAYSNVINLRQFRSLTREVSFVQSDVFERINKLYYLIFANMPQTPFRLTQSRPDKNGGVDGLKYNREVLQNWQKYAYENGRLIMLHSLLSSPKQFSRIVEQTNCQVEWESPCSNHIISKKDYNAMETGLASYLEGLIQKEQGQVRIQGQNFIVPAKVIVIKRKVIINN